MSQMRFNAIYLELLGAPSWNARIVKKRKKKRAQKTKRMDLEVAMKIIQKNLKLKRHLQTRRIVIRKYNGKKGNIVYTE